MDANEAILKINEIHEVIESSNKTIFSGGRMIIIGVLVTLIPAIELATQYLTFGHRFESHEGLIIAVIHSLFYYALFSFAAKFSPYKKATHDDRHPLIKKAFSLGSPFQYSIFGLIFALSFAGLPQLIHPMVFILLGLMFSLYGRFTIPAVTYIAYSYILVGVIYAAVSQQNYPGLWIYMTVYNGLSYIAMGLFLIKEQNKR